MTAPHPRTKLATKPMIQVLRGIETTEKVFSKATGTDYKKYRQTVDYLENEMCICEHEFYYEQDCECGYFTKHLDAMRIGVSFKKVIGLITLTARAYMLNGWRKPTVVNGYKTEYCFIHEGDHIYRVVATEHGILISMKGERV